MQFQISALIFDMDGVITDTMPYHLRAWKSVLGSSGISVSHEDIYKREGQKGIDSVREIFKEKGKIFKISSNFGYAGGTIFKLYKITNIRKATNA